ncbi:MAG: electron transfer flavoprotein subunit beta/FixA family protein [Deltaproteobacteria bacterium]|nr:electron transfer flavoprotein subunit beta/FixA family protein [Deltaproteobacteria bacterium]
MDIIVCLKRVPDAAGRVDINATGLDIGRETAWILNPFDEIALNAAIVLKEKLGGSVTLVHAGAEAGEELLRKGIALGADAAVYLKDPAVTSVDGITVARALSSIIRSMPFDIILCGRRGSDTDAGITGPAIAAFLDIPVVSSIKTLDINPDARLATATADNGATVVECMLPALFTADRGLSELIYPTLSGIMNAKKTPIRTLDLKAAGVDIDAASKSSVRRERLSLPQKTRKGVILEGALTEQVKAAARFLRRET